jgi:HAMP domain-containing protein
MRGAGERIEAVTERINERIVTRPRTVVVAFLVVTALFAGGIPAIETQTDITEGFTEGLPEPEALDSIDAEFDDSFEADAETTQLIHVGNDVLTREELLAVLRVLERVEDRDDLRMASATGPAPIVAQALDPTAQTAAEQRRAVQRATDSEIRRTVRRLSEDSRFSAVVSDDFNPNRASASASVIASGSFIGTNSNPRPRIVVACSASTSNESGRRVVYSIASSRSGRSPTGTMICGFIIRISAFTNGSHVSTSRSVGSRSG